MAEYPIALLKSNTDDAYSRRVEHGNNAVSEADTLATTAWVLLTVVGGLGFEAPWWGEWHLLNLSISSESHEEAIRRVVEANIIAERAATAQASIPHILGLSVLPEHNSIGQVWCLAWLSLGFRIQFLFSTPSTQIALGTKSILLRRCVGNTLAGNARTVAGNTHRRSPRTHRNLL